ncbi:hypothetical protein Celaphus_00018232 [Cervus elaphus hippelaphus]|uniref:Uncharacterized protein n=1 Tax=Cervus elaphus hippelaphus TaxID=46360 RepID=A0A212C5B7_CEREH|nr:hypothetical protein Celaphus_00018232 [Cervus elaphus hippelaphus]
MPPPQRWTNKPRKWDLHWSEVFPPQLSHRWEEPDYPLAAAAQPLIHTSVVDTMVLFPHPLGLPHKRSRKGLVADCLQSLSSSENATACIELVLWKVKDDLKGKKEPPGPRIS